VLPNTNDLLYAIKSTIEFGHGLKKFQMPLKSKEFERSDPYCFFGYCYENYLKNEIWTGGTLSLYLLTGHTWEAVLRS